MGAGMTSKIEIVNRALTVSPAGLRSIRKFEGA